MPVYVYRCDRKHQREITQSIGELDEAIICHCGHPMHRVPQAFRWGNSAWDILYNHLDMQYRAMRGRKGKRAQEDILKGL